MKLKKFRLHWEATINHYKDVEAYDEEDAREQFHCVIKEDEMPKDDLICAELIEVEEIKPKKVKKK
jgi:hypothetical protein